MGGRQCDSNHQEEKYVIFETQPCCTQGYFSDIFNGIQNTLISFLRLNIDQITVYRSLFINKANVNRGSRNGMTYKSC